ncbi:hypothetical protein [Natronococcus jeotgali]|uniref:Apea-like HEPN domain-containing protein n=1 Tax=Natronococcus jeotgali DSM 18795 TaxID=1227498 RepID=L9WVG2_9EURY|nr:hypothetical protein [Natronococcus jeotgali]ELY52338.1 hypothetical protein C492_19439 [Natronococcus jeotgali DSM 18795]
MEVAAEWVQFEIPYILQVEDSFEGNKAARFRSSVEGVPAELQFKKEAREGEEGERPGMMFGQVEGDRLGNVSYTKVKVGFDRQLLDTLPDDLDDDFEAVKEGGPTKWLKNLDGREGRIIRAAVDHVNQFLEVYRASLGYYWIRGVSPSEVVYFMRATVSENGDTYDHGTMYPGNALTPGSSTIDKEAHDTIEARLDTEHKVPITISLRLDAQDKLDLGEYRLAVITAGTMFEAFLKDGLKDLMTAQGMPDDKIESVFVDDGDYTSITTLAKETVPKTLHFDFEATDEFEAWDEKTREMRNRVVHEGYVPSEEEARAAYEAAADVVEFLTDKMIERHEKLRD